MSKATVAHMRYETASDTLTLIIPLATPIEAIQALIEGLPHALKSVNESNLYYLNVYFEIGTIRLDEMAMGCILRQSDDQAVTVVFQGLVDSLLSYNESHSRMYRNELVPFGLDLMFNYLVSLYQHNEKKNKPAYLQLARFMKAQDWDHVGNIEIWLTNYVIIREYGFDTSEYQHLGV